MRTGQKHPTPTYDTDNKQPSLITKVFMALGSIKATQYLEVSA